VEKFTSHTGRVVPLRRSDVDTDQIIPAEYLKRVSRTGFEDGLFAAWRAADPGFVLNQPEHAGGTILVAGPDFGTGSSREHAVWALQDFGFRAVLSPRFGDIFRGNSLKAGLLTVIVPEQAVEDLWARADRDPAGEVTVDLAAREVRYDDVVLPFELDDHTRWRLLNGYDDVSLTLQHGDEIAGYEARRPGWLPSTAPRAAAGAASVALPAPIPSPAT
jgi:3-isopropylmalate/(R)-2-methylmalate dehydratase small subunit